MKPVLSPPPFLSRQNFKQTPFSSYNHYLPPANYLKLFMLSSIYVYSAFPCRVKATYIRASQQHITFKNEIANFCILLRHKYWHEFSSLKAYLHFY